MSQKILIVGAGPGGLSTAMRLAAAGYEVSIYEAADRVGGRMRGLSVGDYHFDTGPTILQVPRVYEELFATCGLNFYDYVTLTRLDPNTRIKFWDNTHLDLSSDLASFKQQLATFGADLPEAFDRWYIEHLRKDVIGYGPYLGSPVRSPLGYLKPTEIAAALPFRPWETLYQHFERFFPDERLVYAMGYQAKYLGMHPTACSSVFSLVTFLEFHYGIWHPKGGFRALAGGLARAAQDLGVQIHLNSPVRQVVVEEGKAKGLLLADGSRVMADAVVLNADFGHAVQNLLPAHARGPYTDRKLDKMEFSCSTFMLYLGVDRRWEDLPHHQLYLSENIRRHDPMWAKSAVLDEENPSFYVCNPTIVDPANAPEGHSTLFVLVPIPNLRHGVDWSTKQVPYRERILRQMAKLGYEDIERHIVAEHCYTAESWRDEHRTHLGAVFNLIHSWNQLGPLRPHIRHNGAKNLYWIGGAVHPGSGLLTILEAAKSAAHFIGEDLPTLQRTAHLV
ncbi:phytoene desaturase family protein [Candidatus Chloroploca asiatica]|uniref:Phytoene dehydrogenase n=1 Tax=Candidatus Chloroploca asiatica TaxID=1506545 RepID=A0A2H3KKM7_9CHLR|nr:phytoene desaturase family protein [Candidatus Chloroploca asiatica]PDV98501.1 phytoene dehydrogenase [Candidatus Chloroploca asiatica]